MKPASIRARMTLGLTLCIVLLTGLGSAGLWLQAYLEAQRNASALLATTSGRVRAAVGQGASWAAIAAMVREQNLAASAGEIELWRLGQDGHDTGHIPAPPHREPFAPGAAALARKPIPPLDDPHGWMTQRVPMGQSTLLIGVPWHKTRRALDAQALALLLLSLLTSGAAGIGAWILVGRTLLPIERLATQARAWASADRTADAIALQAPSPDHEVRELVSTFNALLDRVTQGAQQRERFHASASHELRTPLQALSGTLQLALARPRSPDELRVALQNALTQTDRLNALTRDLLLLNQLGNRSVTAPLESVDVAEACDLALSSLQRPLAEQALRLQENLLSVDAQALPSHVEMLCRNLLENAVKYAPPGGLLRVETVPQDAGGPLLRVWNETAQPVTGDLSAWFEPFYRPDAARSSQTGGNGLGLAICRAVCEANGWFLTLEATYDKTIAGVRVIVRFA